ncbi:acyl-CoA reductase [Elizabethkingia sp. JS20170427COW]|uniref:acyl-CoA reductase n=1 Tax=Elizabethkingia sp. JS20170427COW TaxID=2583851 RepID=UPI00111065D7|nr:acyl-CoA reductase [Elizabethkingia sp. JS20170427COW]QCX52253.1 acyl-CoA reductase [Elizabethkingia sp. JS20170427COW]
MDCQSKIKGLESLALFLKSFLNKEPERFTDEENELNAILRRSEIENPWFTQESLRFSLEKWSLILNEKESIKWVENYTFNNSEKKIGLILAGNIPMVGFHDIVCVILSGNIPVIKLSSKDRLLIPFLLKKWNDFTQQELEYQIVEKLQNVDAVIATGSNNTARYLEYYFKDYPNIIRKNRTSVAVLTGKESDEDLQKLSEDIFRYFGLGCRNVTRLFLSEDFPLERLFENFMQFKDIINHHKYANNYDYNRAIYLLNQDAFWDNNFVLLKEDQQLFSPLAVLNFSRYKDLGEVTHFIQEHEEEIQCVVASSELGMESVGFGEAQNPSISTYADGVDTMEFLSTL